MDKLIVDPVSWEINEDGSISNTYGIKEGECFRLIYKTTLFDTIKLWKIKSYYVPLEKENDLHNFEEIQRLEVYIKEKIQEFKTKFEEEDKNTCTLNGD